MYVRPYMKQTYMYIRRIAFLQVHRDLYVYAIKKPLEPNCCICRGRVAVHDAVSVAVCAAVRV